MLQDDLDLNSYPPYDIPQHHCYSFSRYPANTEEMSPSSIRDPQSCWIPHYNLHSNKNFEDEEIGSFTRYQALQTYTNTCLTDVSQYSSPRELMKSNLEVAQECSQFQRPLLNKRHSIEAQRQRRSRGSLLKEPSNIRKELGQGQCLLKKRKLGRPKREEPGSSQGENPHDAIKGMIFEQKMKRKVDVQKWQNSVLIEIPGVRIRSVRRINLNQQEEKGDVKNLQVSEREKDLVEEATDDESYASRHLEAAQREFRDLYPFMRTKARKQNVSNVIRITLDGPSIQVT